MYAFGVIMRYLSSNGVFEKNSFYRLKHKLTVLMWITCSGVYVNCEFLKITAPIVFNQRFEPGTMWSMLKAGQMK